MCKKFKQKQKEIYKPTMAEVHWNLDQNLEIGPLILRKSWL